MLASNNIISFGCCRFGLIRNTQYVLYMFVNSSGVSTADRLMEKFSTIPARLHLGIGQSSLKSPSLLKVFKSLIKLFSSGLISVPGCSMVRCPSWWISGGDNAWRKVILWVSVSYPGPHDENFGSFSPLYSENFDPLIQQSLLWGLVFILKEKKLVLAFPWIFFPFPSE